METHESTTDEHWRRELEKSEKGQWPAFFLCFFLGVFGMHRFYVGKTGTGILQLFTLGGLGFWALIDMVRILTGGFKDKQGRTLR